jgi:hypothetical protein
MASLNSRIPFPSPLPSSGNLPGPKMIKTMRRMKKMWVGSNKPSMLHLTVRQLREHSYREFIITHHKAHVCLENWLALGFRSLCGNTRCLSFRRAAGDEESRKSLKSQKQIPRFARNDMVRNSFRTDSLRSCECRPEGRRHLFPWARREGSRQTHSNLGGRS